MPKTFAQKIIDYTEHLHFEGVLPESVKLLNPVRESELVRDISRLFYQKFYNDMQPRTLILGINPGRLGAGATGIPFTDTHRLSAFCGIPVTGIKTHEPSSVFVYDLIMAMGGPQYFYDHFIIHSVCPLGFTKNGVNYNYYDDKELQHTMMNFITDHLENMFSMGCKRDLFFCLGTGKNYQFLMKLNMEKKYFNEIIPLEHPRYIMQYKRKSKQQYIDQFCLLLFKAIK
ncbi:MAG: DUF4918 family protein [Saprospiraceae bacterium]|nr:DUF4918 family protein [Saprospiraceae bacterium]